MTIKEVAAEGSTYEISLEKLIGLQVKDVRGYISMEFGEPTFKLTSILFEDNMYVWCEGEHDFPYLTDGPKPIFDDDIMRELWEEGNSTDTDE